MVDPILNVLHTLRLVSDEMIPGTLNVGYTPPTIAFGGRCALRAGGRLFRVVRCDHLQGDASAPCATFARR